MYNIILRPSENCYKLYINSTQEYSRFSTIDGHRNALAHIADVLNTLNGKILLKSRRYYGELILAGTDPRKFIYFDDNELSDKLGDLLYISNTKIKDMGITDFAVIPRNGSSKGIRYTGPAQSDSNFLRVNTFIINYAKLMHVSLLADIKRRIPSMKYSVFTQDEAFGYFDAVLKHDLEDATINTMWNEYSAQMKTVGYDASIYAMWRLAKEDIAYPLSDAYFIPSASIKEIQDKYALYFEEYIKYNKEFQDRLKPAHAVATHFF